MCFISVFYFAFCASIVWIIEWMNANQGFVMGVLTAIYVFVTLRIYRANKNTIEIMKESIIQDKKTNEESKKVQLFDIRFSALMSLEFLYNTLNIAVANGLENEEFINKLLNLTGNDKKVAKSKKASIQLEHFENVRKLRFLFDNITREKIQHFIDVFKDIYIVIVQIEKELTIDWNRYQIQRNAGFDKSLNEIKDEISRIHSMMKIDK